MDTSVLSVGFAFHRLYAVECSSVMIVNCCVCPKNLTILSR